MLDNKLIVADICLQNNINHAGFVTTNLHSINNHLNIVIQIYICIWLWQYLSILCQMYYYKSLFKIIIGYTINFFVVCVLAGRKINLDFAKVFTPWNSNFVNTKSMLHIMTKNQNFIFSAVILGRQCTNTDHQCQLRVHWLLRCVTVSGKVLFVTKFHQFIFFFIKGGERKEIWFSKLIINKNRNTGEK